MQRANGRANRTGHSVNAPPGFVPPVLNVNQLEQASAHRPNRNLSGCVNLSPAATGSTSLANLFLSEYGRLFKWYYHSRRSRLFSKGPGYFSFIGQHSINAEGMRHIMRARGVPEPNCVTS